MARGAGRAEGQSGAATGRARSTPSGQHSTAQRETRPCRGAGCGPRTPLAPVRWPRQAAPSPAPLPCPLTLRPPPRSAQALVRAAFGKFITPGLLADGSDATRALLGHLRAALPGLAQAQPNAFRWAAKGG